MNGIKDGLTHYKVSQISPSFQIFIIRMHKAQATNTSRKT